MEDSKLQKEEGPKKDHYPSHGDIHLGVRKSHGYVFFRLSREEGTMLTSRDAMAESEKMAHSVKGFLWKHKEPEFQFSAPM